MDAHLSRFTVYSTTGGLRLASLCGGDGMESQATGKKVVGR